jgi:RHS repeat-associated protein
VWQGLVLLGMLLSSGAYAQETVREWTLEKMGIPFPPAYSSEAEVQQAVLEPLADLVFPYGPISFEVASQSVQGDRVVYDYQIKPVPPITGAWAYWKFGGGGSYPTQAALIAALKESSPSSPECPTTRVGVGSWVRQQQWDNGESTRESAGYLLTRHIFDGDGCIPDLSQGDLVRGRTIRCPNSSGFMSWRDDLNACGTDQWIVDLGVLSQYSSPLLTNQCQVGNPCDPTTGDKTEPVMDIDLGWVRLVRTHHSMGSAASGFGVSWTHSHHARLILPSASASTIGLLDTDGTHVAFQPAGDGYTAMNSSGDRLVRHGERWHLARADRVLVFGADGRLLQQHHDDGSTLRYAYDARGQLLSLTHSSGRQLSFVYASAVAQAPIQAIRLGQTVLAAYTYSPAGLLETVTYAEGSTHRYHYEDPRYPQTLTGVTREDGQRYSTFAYDHKGRVISSQHADGADGIRLSYPATGGGIVTDALGKATAYGVLPAQGNTQRLLNAISDSTGTMTRDYYDAATDFRRRVKTVIDRGVRTEHAYAESADSGVAVRVHTITEAVGTPQQRVREERHEIASNRLAGVAIGTEETRITRNSRGQPMQMTVTDTASGAVRTTTYRYCEAVDGNGCPWTGLLLQVDGPLSGTADTTTYTYYPADDATCATTPSRCAYRQGDLWKVTNALGQVTQILAYDSAGRVQQVKDPNSIITDLEYHPRGWLTARKTRGANNGSEADDQITRIEYWPTGLVKKVTQPDGAFTAYTYDAAHRLTGITDNAGNRIHYVLDKAGNRIQEDTKDTSGNLARTLSRVYNQLGQLATHADAQAHPTDFTYDIHGNPDTRTDALGRVTDNDYDPLNRLARTLQDVGGIAAETKFQYDARDHLTHVTDPKGLDTTYTYNGLGDLIQLQSPDTGTTTYTYDSTGNRKTQTDARGVTTHYGYDALSRLTSVEYPDATLNVAYTYDLVPKVCAAGEGFAIGRLSGMSDSSGSTQYCYDRFGHLVRKVQTTNGITFVLRYAYTLAGQLQAMVYPDGTTVDYGRDAQGRITEIGVARTDHPREVLLHQARYHPFGPVAGWRYGNGRQMTRSLDQDYRPLAVQDSGTGGLSLNFGFDAVGNLTQLTSGTPPPLTFVYDPLGRLTETRDGPTQVPIDTYTYDKTGNRTAHTTAAGTRAYGYPTTSHRLTDVGGVIRGYDAAGNTLTIGAGKQFVYNAANRMSQVKQGGVVAMNYAYNGKGEQVRRWVRGQPETRVTNLAWPSDGTSGWGWSGAARGATRTLTQESDPFGGSRTMRYQIKGGSAGQFGPYYNRAGTFTVGQVYTSSIWLKGQTGGERVRLALEGSDMGNSHFVTITDQWARYSVTATKTTATGAFVAYLQSDGQNDGFYVAGGQIEAASEPGAYVATVDGPATATTPATGRDVHHVYDEAGRWLGDYDDTGAALQQAIWMDDLPVGLIANDNRLHYIQPDHLGTPRVVIEASRNVPVWTWDAKGEVFGNTAPDQDPDRDGNPFVFDMRFPGQRYDSASGSNYNYFRDYESASGRYVQSDPVGLLGGISTYAYVGGNPISNIDPDGLQFLPYSRNINTRPSSGQRLPDGVAQRLNVYWGGATGGAAVGIAGPYVVAGGVLLTPEVIAAGIATAKKGADACKTPEFQQGVLRACLTLGICSKDKPDQWVDDLQRLQQTVEGSIREAQQRGSIIYPRPPGP